MNFYWQTKKLDMEWTMKRVGKSGKNKKLKKNNKTIVEMPHVNKNEIANFCSNAIFSLVAHSTLVKKNHDTQSLSVWLYLLLRRDQNHHFNLTLKVMTASEQIFKKTTGRIRKKNSKNRTITSTVANYLLIETITSLHHLEWHTPTWPYLFELK